MGVWVLGEEDDAGRGKGEGVTRGQIRKNTRCGKGKKTDNGNLRSKQPVRKIVCVGVGVG